MMRRIPGWYWTLVLCLFSLSLGLLAASRFATGSSQNNPPQPDTESLVVAQQPTSTSVVVQATSTHTPTVVASPTNTLLPPPTLEPPTPTLLPSATPSLSPTLAIFVNATVEGLQGIPTETPPPEETCVPREDWKLRVEVQMNDTLTSIAQKFSIDIWTLAAANCLKDMNMIRVGQQLRVPGDSLPQEPAVVCSEFTVLQPIDRASGIPASGQLVFNWEGPDSPRNLLRLYPPDYDFNVHDPSRYKEYVFDLRHNETVNLADLPEGGKWHWQIFPLDWGFTQVCPESPLWAFNKAP